LSGSALGFSATGAACSTGSFFQGLLLITAGFSYVNGAATGLSSTGFLFHGNVPPPIPPVVGAVTFASSFFWATTLDTTWPKGAIYFIGHLKISLHCLTRGDGSVIFFSKTDFKFDTDWGAGVSIFFSSGFVEGLGVEPIFFSAGKGFSAGFFSNMAFKLDTLFVPVT
jgi:hypothetical protein